jgi:hypothetical protein
MVRIEVGVHRCRSGQAVQVSFGKRTVLPGSNGMTVPAGQVTRPAAQSTLNWSLANRPVLRTRHALQKTASSGSRSRTSPEGRRDRPGREAPHSRHPQRPALIPHKIPGQRTRQDYLHTGQRSAAAFLLRRLTRRRG